MDAEVLHIDAVNEHFALLHIVVTGNQVYERRLATAALSYECDGLALRNHEVDVLQHILFTIGKAHILELYLVFEAADVLGVRNLLDGVLGHQDLVDTLHRGQSLGNAVAGL